MPQPRFFAQDCSKTFSTRVAEGLGRPFGDITEPLWSELNYHKTYVKYTSEAGATEYISDLVR